MIKENWLGKDIVTYKRKDKCWRHNIKELTTKNGDNPIQAAYREEYADMQLITQYADREEYATIVAKLNRDVTQAKE